MSNVDLNGKKIYNSYMFIMSEKRGQMRYAKQAERKH